MLDGLPPLDRDVEMWMLVVLTGDKIVIHELYILLWEPQNFTCFTAETNFVIVKSSPFLQTVIAEQQRDEALSHVKALKEKMEHMSITGNSTANFRTTDFRGMPLQKLKNIQVGCFWVRLYSFKRN